MTGRGPTLPDLFFQAERQSPNSLALVDENTRQTYHDLMSAATSFAGALRKSGFEPGEVVLVQLPNWWESIVASWGTWLAGGILLPVVPIYRAHELSFIIEQTSPSVIVAPQEYRGYRHADHLEKLMRTSGREILLVEVRGAGGVRRTTFPDLIEFGHGSDIVEHQVDSDDIALVLYTSGTTSAPKGVLHSHRTLIAESASMIAHCGVDSQDRIFMPSPLAHITGISYAVVLPVTAACSTVLMQRWEPEAAVALIEREQCTFTVSATPFLRGLADAYEGSAFRRSQLTRFVCGGAGIPPELVRRAHRVMGTSIVRTYGSTELPTLVMGDPFGDIELQAEDEGTVIGGNELEIGEDSELLVRGPELFVGYVDGALNDDSFTEKGFFRTGDVATVDNQGHVRITSRIKDIINRGGEKFSAAEIEWALEAHPAVAEVAVVGYPDEVLGERACAFVVPEGAPPSVRDLRIFLLSEGFAVQKAPERVEIVCSLPRTESGKVQKFLLRGALGLGSVQTVPETDGSEFGHDGNWRKATS
ncbi:MULTISPECIES: AMP-binding protein [unclassified Rhodococcus (in: high G+C Gram-positive bacteria)]|uniref:AMP-binding protein n=1 Tax=unclassified Rhodococcus (in: high G+C Gram-positive bacteria) TaxID=192944 RepID=UPI0005DB9EA9|nr:MULTISPECIES: AMP-binding protein [unclassified Rhodococcus (in: high G+C Gram-positive bacteria)]KJF19269.1 Short-chain-fatty-acid--CoA ligase [Rhodococcus sp. AD45]